MAHDLTRRRLLTLAGAFAASGSTAAKAQAIESQLTLITPVAKTLTDPALADFAKYAKERWNITVQDERAGGGHAGRLRPHRRVEGPARGRHLLGRRERALRQARRAEAAGEARPAARRWWTRSRPASASPSRFRSRIRRASGSARCSSPTGSSITRSCSSASACREPKDWDDLLHPKLKGNVAQCAPTRSSSSHATYEVILQRDGDDKGWEWLKRLAANTGIFTARSRDVPSVVAKGEFAAGFAVPSYMAFEDRLAGFDIKFVAPKTAWITPEPIAILAGAKHPKAARAFIEFLLSERGQRVAMERGVFPITPKYRVQGAPGSTGGDGGRVHRRHALLLRRRRGQHLRRRRRAEALRGGQLAVPQGHRVGLRRSSRRNTEPSLPSPRSLAMRIAVENLTKRFGPLAVVERGRSLDRGGRAVHPPRPFGLRQDHAAAADRRLLRARRGRDPLRRPRRQRRAAARARHRHGVPELRAVAAHDGVRERRLRAQAAQDRPTPRSPTGCRRVLEKVKLAGSATAIRGSSRAGSSSAWRSRGRWC